MQKRAMKLLGIGGIVAVWPCVAWAQSSPSPTEVQGAEPGPQQAPGPPVASPGPEPQSPPSPSSPPLPPSPPPVPEPGNVTGTPNPNEVGAGPGEWRFSVHGFLRAPLRIGVGTQPPCASGATMATATPYGNVPQGAPGAIATPCALPGQGTTNLHSPYLPDDQYLDWRYTRQWERDWTEVFLNYGNDHVVGTVGFGSYNLTDASWQNLGAQFGIEQAYVTLTPSLPAGIRLEAKVGSFWNKYGTSGKYDAGMYDTYLFGRTHGYGEVVKVDVDAGDFTFHLSHGFGAKTEQGPDIGSGSIQNTFTSSAGPGFTLLNHAHLGVSYKKTLDVTLHYLGAYAQDAQVKIDPTGAGGVAWPDGSETVVGGEARFTGGVFGELYAGFSHIGATHVEAVGPAIEVVHALGGGGINGQGNGLIDNYLGQCVGSTNNSAIQPAIPPCKPQDVGNGSVDTLLVQYDYNFGLLWRKLKNPAITDFWGDGTNVRLSLFGMYTMVSSSDTSGNQVTAIAPYYRGVGDGVNKLKFGADLLYSALPWIGGGVRFDYVSPSQRTSDYNFQVISPRIILRSHFVTHEELTLQYSHYFYASEANTLLHVTNVSSNRDYGSLLFPPDSNVFGMKATMWW